MKEIIPGIYIYIGDYVVCLHNYQTSFPKNGDVYKISENSRKDWMTFEGQKETGFYDMSRWRKATPEEVQWHLLGNKTITNIPKRALYELY